MKVKVQHCLVVTLSAAGDVTFKPEFLAKVKEVVTQLGKSWDAKGCNMDLNAKAIVVELHGVDLEAATAIKTDVVQKIVLLAEHGPDGDLLDLLLQRHPELKTHPDFSGLMSAFENMTNVLKGILSKQDSRTLAEVQRRQTEGIEIQPEDLQSSAIRRKDMTTAERQQFREQAILGQTEEQKRAKPVQTEPQIPEVYKKMAEKKGQQKAASSTSVTPKAYGPPLPGDEGNVFTRQAKGKD